MGLDMYFFAVKGKERIEISYWRKHPNLHGWMENLWRVKKSGTNSRDFNCYMLRLSLKNLSQLERDIKDDKLPETTGFFFGSSSPLKHMREYDLEQVRIARGYIKNGYRVFYNSWW